MPFVYVCEEKDDVYMSLMTDKFPVLLELMKLNECGCKTSYNTMRCKCGKNELMCRDLCKCVSCKNDGTEFDVTEHHDSSEVQLWLLCLLIIL